MPGGSERAKAPQRRSGIGANNDGLPWRNVERAKARLGVVARREPGPSRRWVWALPDRDTGAAGAEHGPPPAP